MNRGTLWILLVALCALGNSACGGSSGSQLPQRIGVQITTAPTSMALSANANVVASVTGDAANGGVTWNCTPAASCGTASFNPDQTASGAVSVFTAPASTPSGGTVTITATSVTDASVNKSANITVGENTHNFSFYVSGTANSGAFIHQYTIAGVVTIAADGTVVGGEQDFNDGELNVTTDDVITGGTLVVANDGSGNATLTLTTASGLGEDGVETLALNFPNTNHGLIIQFDESGTSSGSFDLQTSTALPSGSFSFVAAGSDANSNPITYGGVFTVTAGAISGKLDVNDAGIPSPDNRFTGTLGTPDSLGRGTVDNGNGIPVSFVYYVVGPKVIRIIDVDAEDSAVGSAYSQGSNPNFSNGSIGQSVFSISNGHTGYAAAGQFVTFENLINAVKSESKTNPQGLPACMGMQLCSFVGVADLDDFANFVQTTASSITGSYSVPADGYGSLSFDESAFGDDVEIFGVYAVDPTLNILDPNDTADGLGGALISEMDDNLVGIGSIVPQTDITVASFSGSYTFGAQGDAIDFEDFFEEFDFLGSATVVSDTGAFNGTGSLNDPFGSLFGILDQFSGLIFGGTASPDGENPGRYSIDALFRTATNTGNVSVNAAIYQAYAGQLFWVGVGEDALFGGSLEQVFGPFDYAKKAKLNNKKH